MTGRAAAPAAAIPQTGIPMRPRREVELSQLRQHVSLRGVAASRPSARSRPTAGPRPQAAARGPVT